MWLVLLADDATSTISKGVNTDEPCDSDKELKFELFDLFVSPCQEKSTLLNQARGSCMTCEDTTDRIVGKAPSSPLKTFYRLHYCSKQQELHK